ITNDRKRQALEKKAADLVAQIRGGKSLDAVAQELGLAPQTTKPLKRTDTADGFGRAAVAALFDAPQGGITTAYDAAAQSYQLIRADQVDVPAFDPSSQEAQQLDR